MWSWNWMTKSEKKKQLFYSAVAIVVITLISTLATSVFPNAKFLINGLTLLAAIPIWPVVMLKVTK